VIREAEVRGWCEDADIWLEELGLEGRRDVLPSGEFAMVELGRPGAVAVRVEPNSWVEVLPEPPYRRALSEDTVRGEAARTESGEVKVLFNGR
jgi:hypothetical protein